MPNAATARITVDELGRKIADLSVPEEELAKYFEVDEAASTPARPELRLNPETVEIPPPTDVEGRARSAPSCSTAPTSSASCAARRATSRSSPAAATRAR